MQAYLDIRPIEPWDPLTLQGAGLYHIAMGAVLGVAAWTRGKEKIVRNKLEHGYNPDEYDDDLRPRRSRSRRPEIEEDEPI